MQADGQLQLQQSTVLGLLQQLKQKWTKPTAHTPVMENGIAGESLQMELPESIGAFVRQSLIQSISHAIHEYQSAKKKIIRIRPSSIASAKRFIDTDETNPTYIEYNSRHLVFSGN